MRMRDDIDVDVTGKCSETLADSTSTSNSFVRDRTNADGNFEIRV